MPRELKWRLVLAFAALYVIWGSTYLAIRIAVETMPPFSMAAVRFLVAGAVLYAWARRRGAAPPTRAQWRSAAIIGTLLLLVGNGGLVWAETRVASGLAALIVGAEPLVVVALDWIRPGGRRPSLGAGIGLAIGFVGLMLLIAPSDTAGAAVDGLGAAVLMLAIVGWAIGSIYSRHADTPGAPLMATGANMLAGAVALTLAAGLNGEFAALDVGAISLRSTLALAYLTLFGAIVGFTAYIWLLRNTTLAKASTYAYVNPIVAVFLGWLILDEVITLRTMLAAVVIVGGVVMISVLPLLGNHRKVRGIITDFTNLPVFRTGSGR